MTRFGLDLAAYNNIVDLEPNINENFRRIDEGDPDPSYAAARLRDLPLPRPPSVNVLTNGGFEIWQRGTAGFNGNLQFTADRWRLSFSTGFSGGVNQETTQVAPGSLASAAFALTTVGAGRPNIQQPVENWQAFRGQTVSASVMVYQATPNALDLMISDGVTAGATTSAPSPVTNTWVRLTVTMTIATNATTLLVSIGGLQAGMHYVDNAMLALDPEPVEFVPVHPADDLLRCQRTYERHGFAAPWPRLIGFGGAANAAMNAVMSFATHKAVTPTMTVVGPWTVTNCGQPSAAEPNIAGYNLRANATAVGNVDCWPPSTAGVIAEANPT